MRRYFVTKPGWVLADADYSQIELRLLAHLSGDENMIAAFRDGEDIHARTAASIAGVPTSEVTPEMRKNAKAINFGLMYGMGDFSLAEDLHISRAEAKSYMDSYMDSYPDIERYLDEIVKSAYEKGYVTTKYGRRRMIPELAESNKMRKKFGERVAMNSPIQGTAADIIKIAMIRVHDRLEKSGLVSAKFMDSGLGPRRKYYTLTEQGRQALEAFRVSFREMTAAVARLPGFREEEEGE